MCHGQNKVVILCSLIWGFPQGPYRIAPGAFVCSVASWNHLLTQTNSRFRGYRLLGFQETNMYEYLLILDMFSGFALEIPASISIAVHIFDDICIITIYSQPSLDSSYFTKWCSNILSYIVTIYSINSASLVVWTPLKNMSSSVGIMTFPIYGKSYSSHVPNHQPGAFYIALFVFTMFFFPVMSEFHPATGLYCTGLASMASGSSSRQMAWSLSKFLGDGFRLKPIKSGGCIMWSQCNTSQYPTKPTEPYFTVLIIQFSLFNNTWANLVSRFRPEESTCAVTPRFCVPCAAWCSGGQISEWKINQQFHDFPERNLHGSGDFPLPCDSRRLDGRYQRSNYKGWRLVSSPK